MEKVCKFAKLDLFMVKPYLKKYMLLLFAVSIPVIITTKNIYMMSFIAMFYGVIMVSYPFALSEKNNIENFYGTLSLKKRSLRGTSGRWTAQSMWFRAAVRKTKLKLSAGSAVRNKLTSAPDAKAEISGRTTGFTAS